MAYYFMLKELVGIEFIAPEQFPPPEVSPLPATDVIIFSWIFCAGASLLLIILANTTRRPETIFVGISAVVLFLSLFMPLMISTPTTATKLSLAHMHSIGAAVLAHLLVAIGLLINPMGQEES
jgi:heme A synthase